MLHFIILFVQFDKYCCKSLYFNLGNKISWPMAWFDCLHKTPQKVSALIHLLMYMIHNVHQEVRHFIWVHVCIFWSFEAMRLSLARWHRYISISDLAHHGFRSWLVTYAVPSHDLNQWWLTVNHTFMNKFKWNLNWNMLSFVEVSMCSATRLDGNF